jgi:hypothetical protein
VEKGVFHADKGYRVSVPSPAWSVVGDGAADLELRHRSGVAGIVVNATCGGDRAGQDLAVLGRHLLVGLHERDLLARDAVTLAGRPATRLVLEAAPDRAGRRLRVEAWVMTDGQCVYDLIYAAPPERFPEWHEEFARILGSFAVE